MEQNEGKTGAVLFFTDGIKHRWAQKRFLRNWLAKIARAEGHIVHSLRIVLCDRAQMLELNQHYLSHSTDTDVISFDMRQNANKTIDGDIYVGLEKVRTQAKEAKHTLFEELAYMMLHGLLHFCGYDDKSASQRTQMRKKELQHMQPVYKFRKKEDVSRETF